jgi:hypothetical protein
MGVTVRFTVNGQQHTVAVDQYGRVRCYNGQPV